MTNSHQELESNTNPEGEEDDLLWYAMWAGISPEFLPTVQTIQKAMVAAKKYYEKRDKDEPPKPPSRPNVIGRLALGNT